VKNSSSRPAVRKVRPRQASRPLPHPDFPLFHHKSGRWAKKVRGQFCYFGKVADDPTGQAALSLWLEQRDELLAGRQPRSKDDAGLTMKDLANRFLEVKQQRVDAGKIKQLSWNDYRDTCLRLCDVFGKTRLVSDLRTEDFEVLQAGIEKTRGPVSTGNEIQRVRVVFKYAYDAAMIDVPMRFGPDFKRPSKKDLRKAKAARGKKMIEAADLLRLIAAADPQLKAMILLGLNCGMGNSDVGNLPLSAVDLDGGWIDYPRPKTGVDRRCPLWQETVKALRESLAKRPTPKAPEAESLVFVTRYGAPWAKTDSFDNPVTKAFRKLLEGCGLHKDRIGFYVLRHIHRTIADGAKDGPAANYIMGHSDGSMGEHYTEQIDDSRIRVVSDHVRRWLFPGSKAKRTPKTTRETAGLKIVG